MRSIDDLEHFVLAEGETLILRTTRLLSMDQIQRMREHVERCLPGRPVLVLPPDIEVMAGKIEVFGVDTPTVTQDDIDAQLKEITDAYCSARRVWVQDGDGEWLYVHVSANPHTFDFTRYNYSLTKPKANG